MCRAAHSIYFDVLGSMGFPGLAVYMALAFVGWRNTQRIILLGKRPDLEWAGDLGRMIQVTFVGFFIAGAALSMAFYDVYLALIGATAAVRWMAERETAASLPRPDRVPRKPGLLRKAGVSLSSQG